MEEQNETTNDVEVYDDSTKLPTWKVAYFENRNLMGNEAMQQDILTFEISLLPCKIKVMINIQRFFKFPW